MAKTFYLLDNVGRVKYTVNHYNGIDTHKDGSPFFGIHTFSNKVKRDKFVKNLLSDGYKER